MVESTLAPAEAPGELAPQWQPDHPTVQQLAEQFHPDNLADCLDPETVMLGYFISGESIHRYIIDMDAGELRLLLPPQRLNGTRGQIQQAIIELENQLDEFGDALDAEAQKSCALDAEDLLAYCYNQNEPLQQLYELLEIGDSLRIIQTSGRVLANTSLLFSPEGILHAIPLAALYDRESYLYQKVRDIHSTIGLRILKMQQQTALASRLNCIFFGAPNRLEKDEYGQIKPGKNWLWGVRQEFLQVKNILGPDNIIGFGYGGAAKYQACRAIMRNCHAAGTLFYFSGHGSDARKGITICFV